MKLIKKSVSVLLSFVMVISLFTIIPFEASAETNGNYVDRTWDAESKSVASETKAIPADAIRYEGQRDPEGGKWYYIDGILNKSERVNLTGDMNLVLCDGSKLTFENGINVPEGVTLTVCGGEQGTGELVASTDDATERYAAIGGGKKQNGGSVIIKGGKVTASSSYDAAAIGGGGGDYFHLKGNVEIYGGIVTAKAGKYGAGIGAAYYGNADGNISIYGGTVTATGGEYGAGIGGGEGGDLNGSVNIYGGNVTATGGDYASGIGGGQEWRGKGGSQNGAVNISGGVVTAKGGEDAAGIGGGEDGHQNGAVNITDCSVSATGGSEGAGIGGGESGNGGRVIISNSIVNSTGGSRAAGIGGGEDGDSGMISIRNSSKVVVTRGIGGGAGIGGGIHGTNRNIYISDSSVTAKMQTVLSAHGAGIGSGGFCDQKGAITIERSKIYAESGQGVDSDGGGAGIGSGERGNGGEITIYQSEVLALSYNGAAIGSGSGGHPLNHDYVNGGEITIDSSTVTTAVCGGGAGIGGGEYGHGGTIRIDNSDVTAFGGSSHYVPTLKKPSPTSTGEAWGYLAAAIVLSHSGYGAGIGGGTHGNGGNVTINKSKVIAVANNKSSAVAIGRGHKGENDGTLTFENSVKVNRGKIEKGEKEDKFVVLETVSPGERVSACRNNKAIQITLCDHPSAKGYRKYDEQYHEMQCTYCGDWGVVKEPHEWGQDGKCIKCGGQPNYANVTMEYQNDRGKQTKNYQVAMFMDYTLPDCPEAPTGKKFFCWRVDEDNCYAPGETIVPKIDVLKLKAEYLQERETPYIDHLGEESTVKAIQLTDRITLMNRIVLTSGWYALRSNIKVSWDFQIIVIGDAHLILTDDATLSFADSDVQAISGGNLLIYGQKGQTGVLDCGNRDTGDISSITQYGGNLKTNKTVKCENYTITRGATDANAMTGSFNLLGGNVHIANVTESKTVLGWTELSDSIKLDAIQYGSSDSINVAENQALVDEYGTVYKGSIGRNEIEGKTLTPYLEHHYGEPEWRWADNYSSAKAEFTCTDQGCGDSQIVNATVTSNDTETVTKHTATCFFYGKKYSESVNVNRSWEIIVRDTELGSVESNKSEAEFGEEITLTVIPHDGCRLIELVVLDEDDNEIPVTDNKFRMPASEVTVAAKFVRYFTKTEPYIDDNGIYIISNNEYCIDESGNYYLIEDGKIGEYVPEDQISIKIPLSYFTYLPYTQGLRITKYSGELADNSVLRIPKAIKDFYGDIRNVSAIGNGSGGDGKGKFVSTDNSFTLELNENISLIWTASFMNRNVTAVTGNTSGLRTIQDAAFDSANGKNGNKIDINLDYEGEVEAGNYAFGSTNVTFHLKHATTVSNTSDTKSVTYDFTDAHIYGDPSWSWANDYSSAKATFTCTDERCKHKETVDATVTVTETTEKVKYTATAAFEGKTYTDTQEIDNEIGTRLVGYSLSLKGDIGVNFYMELSDSVVEHKDTAYMYFTIPGNTTTYQTVFVKDAESEIIDGRTYYKFPCKVAAKEITSQIKAQIHDGVKKGTEYKYSVKDYADYLIEHQDESKMFKDAVDLAKAMMTYGENAKWYFDKTDTPPQKITDVTVPEYERTVYSDNLPEGVSFSGATLSLKSETTLSLYFYGDPNLNLSCTDKGVEYDIERSGKECVIRIRNIAAYELNRDFTVKINGKDAVKYNPLRYCYLSQTSSDEKLANTVKAIYKYWIEAKKYFDKINASAGGNE